MLSSNKLNQIDDTYIYNFGNGTTSDRLPMVGIKDFRLDTTFSTAPGAAGYSILQVGLTNVPRGVKV